MVGFQYGPDRNNNLRLMLHTKKYLFYFIYQFFFIILVIFMRMILILDTFMTFFFCVKGVKRG